VRYSEPRIVWQQWLADRDHRPRDRDRSPPWDTPRAQARSRRDRPDYWFVRRGRANECIAQGRGAPVAKDRSRDRAVERTTTRESEAVWTRAYIRIERTETIGQDEAVKRACAAGECAGGVRRELCCTGDMRSRDRLAFGPNQGRPGGLKWSCGTRDHSFSPEPTSPVRTASPDPASRMGRNRAIPGESLPVPSSLDPHRNTSTTPDPRALPRPIGSGST
jgi:hypothetical protein